MEISSRPASFLEGVISWVVQVFMNEYLKAKEMLSESARLTFVSREIGKTSDFLEGVMSSYVQVLMSEHLKAKEILSESAELTFAGRETGNNV